MSSLIAVILLLNVLLVVYALFWILCAGVLYRIAAGILCIMSVTPGVRRWVAANVGAGTDTFRFTLGTFFAWTVSVNHDKGTLTGSIQLDAARRLGWQRLIVAGLAAALVPVVAGVLMPAALVAVGFGFLRGSPPPARSSAGVRSPAARQAGASNGEASCQPSA
jgi:hypothetical protein